MYSNNLKKLRLEKNLTQDDLSELSGISRSEIANIEVGNIINPSVYCAIKLAKILEVNVEDIFILTND